MNIFEPEVWPAVFGLLFLAIVFLQSGVDKALNYKRELGWIQQKFSKNTLYAYVGPLFFLLTATELLAGLLCLSGIISLLFGIEGSWPVAGAWMACAATTMLIFGQRMTRDYTGAATLVPYFLVSMFTLFLCV